MHLLAHGVGATLIRQTPALTEIGQVTYVHSHGRNYEVAYHTCLLMVHG